MGRFLRQLHPLAFIGLLDHLLILFLAIVHTGIHTAEDDAAEFVALAPPSGAILLGERIIFTVSAFTIKVLFLSILAQVVSDILAFAFPLLLLSESSLPAGSVHALLKPLPEVQFVA